MSNTEDGNGFSVEAQVSSAAQHAEQIRETTRRAKIGFLWLGSATVVRQAVSWALTLLIARILDPRDYGLVALAETVTPYLTYVAAFSLPVWIIQRDVFTKEHEKPLFALTSLLGSGVSLLAFLAAPLVAEFYESPELELPFQILSATFFIRGVVTIPEALLRRELNFKPLAMMDVSIGVSRSVLTLILAYLGFAYWALILGILYREVAMALWLIALRGLPRGFGWNRSLFTEALRYGLPATGAGLMQVVYNTVDFIIIGKLFGTSFLGYYTMAYFLGHLPISKLNGVLNPILVPYFSRLKMAPEELHTAFLKVVKGVAGFTIPVLLGLALVSYEAVPVVLTMKWQPLIIPLQVMCFVGLIRSLTGSVAALLLALGLPRKVFVYSLVSVILYPACFVGLGMTYGIAGIYVTWISLTPLLMFLILFMLKEATGIGFVDYFINLRASLVAGAVMGVAVFLLRRCCGELFSPVLLLVVEVLTGGLTYLAVLWLFFRQEAEEMLRVIKELRSKKSQTA